MESTTDNAFARVLQFYYLYLRAKLVPVDLERIARKYSSKPDKLLSDLQQKYPYPPPERVNIHHIANLCHVFSVPSSFIALLGFESGLPGHDLRVDVYSVDFDPLHCLERNVISVGHLSAHTLDNTAKLQPLLPGAVRPVITNSNQALYRTQSSTSITSSSSAPKTMHIFDSIAELSLRSGRKGSNSGGGEDTGSSSPLLLLHQCMQTRCRVRIVLRRNHSIRGSLDAYILAFDRHFNMLLSDVDEEYITNQQKERAMVKGRFRSQNNVLHRHLPQLLLRGDQVVMVFRKPS